MARKNYSRNPSQADTDWVLYIRLFRELNERSPVAAGPAAIALNRRSLKLLRARLEPIGVALEDYLREYLSLDDKWLDERDYPLRYATTADTYTRIVKRLTDGAPAVAVTPAAEDFAAIKTANAIAQDRLRLEREARDREREARGTTFGRRR